jgi:hypothetical protein
MNKHNFWYSQELRCDILSDIQLGYLPNIGIVQSWDLQMVLVSNPVVWRWKVKLLQQPPLWISLTWGLPMTCLLLCFKEPKRKLWVATALSWGIDCILFPKQWIETGWLIVMSIRVFCKANITPEPWVCVCPSKSLVCSWFMQVWSYTGEIINNEKTNTLVFRWGWNSENHQILW